LDLEIHRHRRPILPRPGFLLWTLLVVVELSLQVAQMPEQFHLETALPDLVQVIPVLLVLQKLPVWVLQKPV